MPYTYTDEEEFDEYTATDREWDERFSPDTVLIPYTDETVDRILGFTIPTNLLWFVEIIIKVASFLILYGLWLRNPDTPTILTVATVAAIFYIRTDTLVRCLLGMFLLFIGHLLFDTYGLFIALAFSYFILLPKEVARTSARETWRHPAAYMSNNPYNH